MNTEELNNLKQTPSQDNIRLMEVYNTDHPHEAHDAVAYLAAHGIDAIVEGEVLHNTFAGVRGITGGISVMVRNTDYARALELLIASGRLPHADALDDKAWHGPLPFMRNASLFAQILVLLLIIAAILGALFLYIYLSDSIGKA